jgi:hypothetical protein
MGTICTALSGRLKRKTVPYRSECSLKENVTRDHTGNKYDAVDYFKLTQMESSTGLFGS